MEPSLRVQGSSHTYNNESVAHNDQILHNVDKKDILLQVQSQENAQ